MYDIKIKPVLNGFVCKVGCKKVVFTNLADMLKELKRYYGAKDPSEVSKDWEENSINSGKGNSALRGGALAATFTIDGGRIS